MTVFTFSQGGNLLGGENITWILIADIGVALQMNRRHRGTTSCQQ